ncbi:MAG: c-type cytochrome [Planctomycetota bacterium JB042]
MRVPRRLFAAALLPLVAVPATAQSGDHPGEAQPSLPPDLRVPPAPVLSPDEERATFALDERFVVELVAAEPLVEDPVQIAWSADGRMWVCEMRGYMPDVDGTGETLPVGRISILEDRDGDGVVDSSVPFVEHLVLPRAIAPSHGGLLVLAPPDLLFYRDRHGDGRADEMLLLHSGFGGIESPEHAGNGLLYGHDNRFCLSQHPLRFTFDGEEVRTERTPGHGQWGIAKDDVGRVFTNTNSDPLRVDLVSAHYGARHPDLGGLVGVNERASHDFDTWPSRMTPGVNRGYQRATLRDDFTLARVTAACGPAIERGGIFPDDARGDAFVAEPAGNLIKRCSLSEAPDGGLRGTNPYERREFLTSTDERFRPVNLVTGPDGALYVVDFYRGVIQHRVFVTSFLRRQIVERGLERPVGLGRIWRIRPRGATPHPRPALDRATDEGLVAALAHPNGWWRDTAQRLLVERRATGAAPSLRDRLRNGGTALERLHALWTLDGLDRASVDDAAAAVADEAVAVRAAGLRVAERHLADPRALGLVLDRLDDPAPPVRRQAILSLGEGRSAAALAALRDVLVEHAGDRAVRSAVLSGAFGWELELLDGLLASAPFRERSDGRAAALKALVEVVWRSRDRARRAAVVERASATDRAWAAAAILDALKGPLKVGTDHPRTASLARSPAGWDALLAREDAAGAAARAIDPRLVWPGRDGYATARGPSTWTDAQRAQLERGGRLYASICASCHQADGRGLPGTAPSLAGADRVLGDEGRFARILLHGLTGPIERDGRTWNGDMPPAAARGDDQIAALLTYVRNAFGNEADPVAPETVAEVRAATSTRVEPWTEAELEDGAAGR